MDAELTKGMENSLMELTQPEIELLAEGAPPPQGYEFSEVITFLAQRVLSLQLEVENLEDCMGD